jgi:hypothetical protein
LGAVAGGDGFCAQDGCGPATAMAAAAMPMQSAKRRNIKALLSMDQRSEQRGLSLINDGF